MIRIRRLRRRSSVTLAATSLVFSLFVTSPLFASAPNVVLIISDDQAWTDFGFMGHADIRTPHIDRLASESAVFTRGYVPTSLCRASLATLATGLYPHQHAITSNDPPSGTDRSLMLRHMSRADTLMRRLSDLGYLSHQSGKWWEGHHAMGGFTHGMTHGDPRRRGRHGDDGLRIGREGMEPIRDFIDTAGDRPFFLWYAPFLPHTPHNPPARLLDHYAVADRPPRLAAYFAMCEWFDETVGELLALLDESGESENTIVAFVVDNGWIQQTGPTRSNSGWFADKSKRSPYDGGVRTPIMIRWPGHVSPGRHEHLASSVDLAVTLWDAARTSSRSSGALADSAFGAADAVNLIDVATGEGEPRSVAFGEIFSHDAVDVDRPSANLQYRWCVDGDWKLIVPADRTSAVELYQIVADPHENKNVAADHVDRVRRLRDTLDDWWSPDSIR